MRFSNITLFAFSATALAIPVTEQAQTDVEVGQEDFSIFDCSIVDCAEALAPLFESCAEAAALEGKDKTKDAKCVADAYSYLKARKPAQCNHCYN